MARINPVAPNRASLLLRLVNWGARRLLGKEIAPMNFVGHNPSFVFPYLLTAQFYRAKSELPPKTRALVMHLVAEINACTWCIDYGQLEATKHGVSPRQLASVLDYATSPHFNAAERAALAFAEAATKVGARVPDEVFAEVRRHYSDRAIAELTVAVALENFYNRINAPLEIESQGFCAPLPAGKAA